MSHRAFTLLELVLVLAVLAVAASFAVPTFEAMITSRKIIDAVDKVQLTLQKARLEAIKTGQAQVFRCHVGTGEYLTQPWLKASDETEASVGATIVTQYGQAIETDSVGGMTTGEIADTTAGQMLLDDGIIFADAQIQNDSRALSEQSVADSMVSATTGWSSPVLLYPDGSTTTAHFVIQDLRGRRFAVQVRGLTGEAMVKEMPSAGAIP
jgi:prepilin-type N-terminal cleavage/methylation domain-containing protein